MTLDELRQQSLPEFEVFLKENVSRNVNSSQTLQDAMLYSLEAGGKRIRPLLLFATLALFNEDLKKGFATAAALEYIHTYSLIHDDLPAMDDDDLRRGKPTNHKVFGEDMAILAGDALLTFAFEILSKDPLISAERRLHLIQLLAQAAGPNQMVAGQVLDMEGENAQLNLAELTNVHRKKTGALLQFSVAAAGEIAEVSSNMQSLLNNFAGHFGLAFQIKDDILDVVGDEKILGKKTGMDTLHEKSTYPSLLTLEGAINQLDEELIKMSECLKEIEILGMAEGHMLDTSTLAAIANMLSQEKP